MMTIPEDSDEGGWFRCALSPFQASPHREHPIQAGETLRSIAAQYQLSGWQGLYYAEINGRFRYRYPDPRLLPLGEAIGIPTAAEQQTALSQRIQTLRALADEAQACFQRQETLVQTLSLPEADLGEATRFLVSTTLTAIRCLQAPEYPHNSAAIALTEDALEHWSLHRREECASLISLLARAAQGAPWLLSDRKARSWCDPRSPNFWAKSFTARLDGLQGADPLLGTRLRTALQNTRSQILQSIDRLRTEAIMERNHLARIQEAEALAANGQSEG